MAIVDQFGRGITSNNKFARGANRAGRNLYSEPLRMKDLSDLIPAHDHDALVSGSRTLFANYGPVREAAIQKADQSVGQAWLPKFTGTDSEWGKEAKAWLCEEWYGACDVRGDKFDFVRSLWLDSIAIDRDGDIAIYLTQTESGYPQIQRVPAHRIGQRYEDVDRDGRVKSGTFAGEKMWKGIITNRAGRTVGYHVLGDKDDGSEDVFIASQAMVFMDESEWHDGLRGLPSFSAGLEFIKSSLRSHEWETQAQLMASAIGLMEFNQDGMADDDDPMVSAATVNSSGETTGASVETFHGGMVRYFRANSGAKLEQLKHERPGDIWEAFQDRVIRLSAGGCWPYELIWKAGSLTGPLVRNLQMRARSRVETRQKTLRRGARRVVGYAIAKAIKQGRLPKSREWFKWDFQMPKKFSIDPGRDGENFRRDYLLGRANLTDGVEEDGGPGLEAHLRERVNEVVLLDQIIEETEKRTGRKVERARIQMLNPSELNAPQASAKEQGEEGEHDQDETLRFENLKSKLDAYGVAVRAGAITPVIDDEAAFRSEAGFPKVTAPVKKSWKEDGGFRRPITLVQKGAGGSMFPGKQAPKNEDEEEETE